ncbi:MAG: tail fiber domain-containing protein, partial [Cyclobacteriaceae bacterium]|nr:tail fiber domain-containing protein [Cyclobacteriaceae bacterium]
SSISFEVDGTVAGTSVPGRVVFATTPTGSSTVTEKMRLTNDGRLGIGTINPSALLDVNGTANLRGLNFPDPLATITFPPVSASAPPMIYMFSSGLNNLDRFVIAHSPSFPDWGLRYSDVPDRFDFVGAGTSRLSILLGTGNIGINTTAPDMLLSVNGNASKVGGGTWATFSDIRLKKDIRSFTDGLNVLMKISPVNFKYNGLGGYENDNKDYVGVIAQEVIQVAPYMFTTVRKKLSENDKDETELLMYDGSALTYILVNSIKEQQAQIDELRREIAELKRLVRSVQPTSVSASVGNN